MQGKLASLNYAHYKCIKCYWEHLIIMEIGRYRFPKRLLAVIAVNRKRIQNEGNNKHNRRREAFPRRWWVDYNNTRFNFQQPIFFFPSSHLLGILSSLLLLTRNLPFIRHPDSSSWSVSFFVVHPFTANFDHEVLNLRYNFTIYLRHQTGCLCLPFKWNFSRVFSMEKWVLRSQF